MKFESRSTDLQALIGNPEPGKGLRSTVMEAGLQFAREALDAGRADLAKRVLEPLTSRAPRAAAAWQLLGFAYRDEQRMPDATPSFERAAVPNPDDALTALGLAQSSFEVGLPAAQLFCRALELAPWRLWVRSNRWTRPRNCSARCWRASPTGSKGTGTWRRCAGRRRWR